MPYLEFNVSLYEVEISLCIRTMFQYKEETSVTCKDCSVFYHIKRSGILKAELTELDNLLSVSTMAA